MEKLNQIREAIKSDDQARMVELINGSTDLLHALTPYGTWLHMAAQHNRHDIAKCLLRLGANVNAIGGPYGGGALNVAASEGHADIVETLIEAGAELDVSSSERNPLWGAILDGHLAVVRLLVEKGLDPHIKYNGDLMKNMDALAFARERGQKEIADYLAGLPR